MDYQKYIESKAHRVVDSGFNIELDDINDKLFPFQKALVKWAVRRGRAAIFADTGLGKSPMQLEWARLVTGETGGRVLIIAPLCVSQQTVREANKFNIDATIEYSRGEIPDSRTDIVVTNYEMVDKFDLSSFSGIVLDESSILKHVGAKFRRQIIDASQDIPYRLSCTATPAPNDYMELGGQAEFLGVMSTQEMLAMFFIHDGGDTSKWRLKGHGKTRFWEWLSTWAMVIKKPSDIGFSDDGYNLPELRFHEHIVESPTPEGELFPTVASKLLDRNKARRESIDSRVEECSSIVNGNDGQWIVWCHLNAESERLAALIDGATEVRGSQKLEEKEDRINDFLDTKTRVMVSKPSIMGLGLNIQQVNKMAFVGLSDSWEQFYQAVRRCWRFGQTKPVDVHIISAQAEGAVLQNIKRKETQAHKMSEEMVKYMKDSMKKELSIDENRKSTTSVECITEDGDGWTMHLGDCVDVVKDIPAESIGYTVFSPPFASLYTYSDDDRDMGNTNGDDDFYQHFSYLVPELMRVTKPGRLLSFHCMNLPSTIQNDGVIGLRDFRGEMIRLFTEHGWIYHSEVCIWKDPVTAMQRTKALGLLWKQLKKDSSMSRMGIPDYVVTMRKPGKNPDPISHTPDGYPVEKWQEVASPIWMDINQSNTLNKKGARTEDDERHICPLQIDVIERCLELWSKHGDVVLSPFAGIGSEGYTALKMGRRFIGVELKKSYFDLAILNLKDAKTNQIDMFPVLGACND